MNEVKELIEFDKIAAGIAEMQEKGNFVPDMTTKEGYNASKRFVLDETTPARTRLDKAHKSAKEYWKVGGQSVDKKKNEILNLLIEIQKPHQEAYKAFDQAEKDKKQKFEDDLQIKIDCFYHYANQSINASSDQITSLIQECGETDTQEGFYHRGSDAAKAKAEAMDILNDSLMKAVSREAEQQREAELAEENRLRQIQIDEQQESMRLQQEKMDAQQAEIDRVANESRAKIQAEEDEKQRLIAKAQQAEEEKQRAIEREQYAKEQSEKAAAKALENEKQRQYNERVEQEAAQAKLEANKKHTGAVRKEIKDHLISSCGLDNDLAVSVVKALLKTNRVTINY